MQGVSLHKEQRLAYEKLPISKLIYVPIWPAYNKAQTSANSHSGNFLYAMLGTGANLNQDIIISNSCWFGATFAVRPLTVAWLSLAFNTWNVTRILKSHLYIHKLILSWYSLENNNDNSDTFLNRESMTKVILAPTNARAKEGKACDMSNCKGCDKSTLLPRECFNFLILYVYSI